MQDGEMKIGGRFRDKPSALCECAAELNQAELHCAAAAAVHATEHEASHAALPLRDRQFGIRRRDCGC